MNRGSTEKGEASNMSEVRTGNDLDWRCALFLVLFCLRRMEAGFPRLAGSIEGGMNMDDLISRKEAENTIRKLLMETAINCADAGDPLDEFYVDIAHNRLETWISLIPAAPVSVPLDKLCEWLGKVAIVRCNGCSQNLCAGDACSSSNHWEKEIKKWMEGLDAAD